MMRANRREFLGAAAGAVAAAGEGAIVVDPKPLFDISPYLYMQFMEPLGASDTSVEAAWDYDADDWRKDFVETARDLAPDVIRYGGLFCRYYKWREGVGPALRRPWMRNYVWGGKETNRVGTHEFVDFCRRVGAEPLYCVNFLGDGEKRYRTTREGDRTGDAREAADWVSYCNDPDHRERKANGTAEPLAVKLWQLGNETSYGNATFSKDESIARTIEFAKAMKARDRSIRLIGWGDRRGRTELWAPDLLKQAGEYLDYVAIHMMGQSPRRKDTVLRGLAYQKDPERAWEELLELADVVEKRVTELEQATATTDPRIGIAITEGHLSLPPHNANPILAEWLSARLSCAVSEHLPAARRAGEDRHGGGFRGQPLDGQCGDATDARQDQLPDAGRGHRAAVQEAQRQAGSSGAVRSFGTGHRRQPHGRPDLPACR